MLPQKQKQILHALHRFKYLTRSQMAKIGIEQYNTNYSKYCTPLIQANMIAVLDAKIHGLGYIYYLKKKGAFWVAYDLGCDITEVNCPKRKLKLDPTIFHRNKAIECHIELAKQCEASDIEILLIEKDIDNLEMILERKTRIPIGANEYIEPDANFMIDTPIGPKLYLLELEYRDSFQKSYDKAKKHISAINQKAASVKYNHPKGHRSLFIFDNDKLMDRVMTKLVKEYGDLKNWMLFKTYDEVCTPILLSSSKFVLSDQKDFFKGWFTITGKSVTMF